MTRPRLTGGQQGGALSNNSPSQTILNNAITLASTALSNPNCASLFAPNIDPVKLLNELSGDIKLADLTGPNGRTIINASTEGITGSILVRRGDVGLRMGRQSVFVGAKITISNNPSAPFIRGYAGRFGATDEVNRAITVIHELGHAANIISGKKWASLISDDDTGPNASDVNNINSRVVYEKCFGSRPNNPISSIFKGNN